ncbi:hypothetical protein A2U01_0053079, partial [Trifolium medium]|nr:hypothetical protein [Trifolium medium]
NQGILAEREVSEQRNQAARWASENSRSFCLWSLSEG